MTSLNINKFLW